MKVEVLKDIKNAEDEYKSTIDAANEARRTLIANAELEADNIVQDATKQAEEYKKQCIANARSQATATYDEIIKGGKEQAAALESKGRQNLDRAIELLVTRFKEQLNVSA
ncbi:MAG: ATP synthase archaeal subunit H [Methanomicrobiales archaeon]|jgi:V/A-type H+-transporting ATPase subunit G/H|nr:ATP synthase archaeal subunit H [Methanomicrobiales archaeon]